MDRETRIRCRTELNLKSAWFHDFRYGHIKEPGSTKLDAIRAWIAENQ